MIPRVVEIAGDNRHLSLSRGFLVIAEGREEVGRVPLDDIAVLLANAHGLTYSNNLLVELARRGAPLVLCGANHMPVAWLWPINGHHVQAARMAAQLGSTRPLAKRLWRDIVRAKVRQQAAVIESLGKASGGIERLIKAVRAGDPENVEAQAARRYWSLLMGPAFRRDRTQPGPNALLNYGYTVLRAATARAVVSAGLHPSLGVHHHNRQNPMCLVDDLMEPFRPVVDLVALRLSHRGIEEVTVEAKSALAGIAALDLRTEKGTTPLATCLMRLATSLAQAYEEGGGDLDLPLSPLPLDLAGVG
jgi:CRISPR-associated protein Cas1